MASPIVMQAILSAILFVAVLVLYLRRFTSSRRWLLVALSVCLLDQGMKALIVFGPNGRRIMLLGGWLQIRYAENWEQGFGGTFYYLLLTTVVCVLALYFLYGRLAKTTYRMSLVAELGCALMIGGYLGILLDRIRWGFVVDFLEFGPASSFIYNLADIAVLIAVALLLARALQYITEVRARRLRLRDEVV